MSKKRREEKFYPSCARWFQRILSEMSGHSRVEIFTGSHKRKLSLILQERNLSSFFPECAAWDIKVDIVACISRRQRLELAFAEIKTAPVTLRDVGQLLGYCRVAGPAVAVLLSPKGISADLHRLLVEYGRSDILTYNQGSIAVARWVQEHEDIDWASLVPPGTLG